jgi:hypothetical protein
MKQRNTREIKNVIKAREKLCCVRIYYLLMSDGFPYIV